MDPGFLKEQQEYEANLGAEGEESEEEDEKDEEYEEEEEDSAEDEYESEELDDEEEEDAAPQKRKGVKRKAKEAEKDRERLRELASKASHTLVSTKRHVNAVTDQMVGPMRSWSDADGLVTAFGDPECAAARKEYLRKRDARS